MFKILKNQVFKNLIFCLGLIMIFVSCSSDSAQVEEDIIDNNNFSITEITPNTGFSGDEIVIIWDGFPEAISEYSVKFNGISSEIISTSSTQLTCIVPENSSTGLISLRLNQTEILSQESFVIQEEPPLNFSVSDTSPNLLRPGYKMTILGNGFGTQIENASIKFPNNNSEMVNAKILNLTNSEIELAIPVDAVTGEIEITINGETLPLTFTLNPVQHKKIYYYMSSRLYSFIIGSDGLLDSTYESSGFSGDVSEIYSLTYDNSDNVFYGYSHYTSGSSDVLKFIGFDDTTNQRYTGLLCSQSAGCLQDHSSVVNSITNKKYTILHNNNGTYYINEIDIFGNTLVQEASFDVDGGYIATHFIFVPEFNSYIGLNDNGNNFRIHKIDATTFQYESFTIGQGVLQFSNQNETAGELVYDIYQNRLFYPRKNNIYSIDLLNNTVENLNTDWYNFIDNDVNSSVDGLYSPRICIYYEPTNEIYIQAKWALDGSSRSKIFAVNLASKQTRRLEAGIGFVYSNSSRVYQWAVKP